MIWRERARPTPVPSARVVGGDTDEGHVVEGNGSRSGLLPEPVAQGIERILQNVRNHLPHQLFIGEEDHVLIL